MIVTITGEAGGIGSGMSVAMAKEGETVAVVDIDEEAGKAMEKKLQEISPESIFIKADLINRENSPNIVEQVGKKYGKLDVLVNNAHASRQKPFEEITKEDFDLSFGTGFYATFYLMKAAFPYLKETKGNIINFASAAGLEGQQTQKQQKKRFVPFPKLRRMSGENTESPPTSSVQSPIPLVW